MLIKSVTKSTTVPAHQIWHKYEDVPNWKTWDPAVKSSQIFGEFIEGTKGTLQPVVGTRAQFEITLMTRYIYVGIRTVLPMAYIDFEHTIFDNGDVRVVTHSIKLGGLLAPLFKLVLGKQLSEGLDEAVENLCNPLYYS
jgi:hypothetical protein